MKKLLFLFCISCTGINAQSNINADCIDAIPLCSTPNFTFNATSGFGAVADIPPNNNISNPQTNPGSTNAGCLQSDELKPQWLLITIGNAGNLEFIFGAGNSPNPQAGFYDWAMWPYTALTCQNIQNNTLPPIRCNWNGSNSGGTGIASVANQPPGSSTSNFEPPLAVLPCQQFIICISNYSGVNTLVSFLSLGTASLTCNPNCINVTSPTLCAGNSASIIASSSGILSGITYSIDPGGTTSPTPTFVVNPLVNTAYTVYASGLNSSGILITQSVVSNATVYPSPQATPTLTQATCVNPANAFSLGLTFIPSGAPPNYNIAWSTVPAGVLSPTQTANTGTMLPGIYSATITAGACSAITNFTFDANPAPASISLTPAGPIYSVTCLTPTVTVNTTDATNSYTWANGVIAPISGMSGNFDNTGAGVWTITAENLASGCISTKTISIGINTLIPTSAISPTFQNITCNQSSVISLTASASPSVNITHHVTSPQGAVYSASGYTTLYTPGSPGTYTHCIVDDVNGCSTCKQFTVFSNQGFPTFNVSSPQSFTLGCSSKSFAIINIIGANTSMPTGGPVSYTFLPPGSPTVIPAGSLGGSNVSTVTIPGTWTVITKDDNSFCETRVPVSVISRTLGPGLDSLILPQQVLDCKVVEVKLEAISETPNVSYNWKAPGITGNLASSTIAINIIPAKPTQTLIADYTLTITDDNNSCTTTSLIPMLQNLYPPKALITSGISALTCSTNSIVLSNGSSSGIPATSSFPVSKPVIGYMWEGPSPQTKMMTSTVYTAYVVGDYTLTAFDMNNSCTSQTVFTIRNERSYPVVNAPNIPPPFILDCATATAAVMPIISSPTTNLVYNWTAPSGVATSDKTKKQLTVNQIGYYRVLTTNTLTGCAVNAEVQVVNDILTGSIAVDQESGYAPFNINLNNLSSSLTGTNSISAVWNFGNGTYSITSSAAVSPAVLYSAAGTYTVKAYVTKGECMDTVSKVIVVDLPSKLQIPNVFTPNGDGVNDLFFLKATNLVRISILIYDRWGHKVYEVDSDKGNIAWDGKDLYGKDSAEGVYMYILKANGKDGRAYENKGNISLLR